MYHIYLPAEPLRPYIDNYWMVRSPQPIVLQENVFVDGKADEHWDGATKAGF